MRINKIIALALLLMVSVVAQAQLPSVNGLWGEDIVLTADAPHQATHQITLRDNWDISNLSIVAFVYKESDGVLQVTEHHINK